MRGTAQRPDDRFVVETHALSKRYGGRIVAVDRIERLVEIIQRRARERAQRFVGRTLDVLVEGTSRTDASRVRGRTRHNKVVNFDGLASPGEIVPVEITCATSQTLAGEMSLLARAG